MDYVTYFLGSAIAFIIALIAWGDAMKSLKAELYALEKEFINSLGKKNMELLPIFRKSRYSTAKRTWAVTNFLASKKTTSEHIEMTARIQNLGKTGNRCEFWLSVKYWFFVILTICSILFGILSKFIGKEQILNHISFNDVFVGLHVIIITLLLFFQIKANILEKIFGGDLQTIMEDLEKE
jgi:hypothetical protein